jgi:uncharacterized protein (TIRG00374 family)
VNEKPAAIDAVDTPAPADDVHAFHRSVRRAVLVTLAAVLFYAVFAMASGAHKLAARMSGYAWWTFGAALCLAFGNYVLRYLKWEIYLSILEIRGLRRVDSFLTFLSGFVLSVSPGKVGEVFKSYILGEIHDVDPVRSAPIVVAERLTDLVGIIVLIAVGSTRFAGGLVWAAAGTAVVSGLVLVVTWRRLALALLDKMSAMSTRLARVGKRLRDGYEALYALTRPKALVLPTLLSIAAWFLEALALWVILRGFSCSPSTLGATFFYATSTLAGALVPVPGGVGVTEKVMQTLMRDLGDVDESATTCAIMLVRFATLWFAVLVGFGALSLLRARHPKLLTAASD